VARVNGEAAQVTSAYDARTFTLTVSGLSLSPADTLEVVLSAQDDLANQADPRLPTLQWMVRQFRMNTNAKGELYKRLPELIESPGMLCRYMAVLNEAQMRALMEVITGAGIDYTQSTGDRLIVAWNNRQDPNVSLQFSLARLHHWWRYKDINPWANDAMPRFQAFRPSVDFGEHNPWVIQASYYGVNTVKLEGK